MGKDKNQTCYGYLTNGGERALRPSKNAIVGGTAKANNTALARRGSILCSRWRLAEKHPEWGLETPLEPSAAGSP